MFSVSVPELGLFALLGIAALSTYLLKLSAARWLVAATGCVLLASLITPPDPASTCIVALGMLACFYFGTRQSTTQSSVGT